MFSQCYIYIYLNININMNYTIYVYSICTSNWIYIYIHTNIDLLLCLLHSSMFAPFQCFEFWVAKKWCAVMPLYYFCVLRFPVILLPERRLSLNSWTLFLRVRMFMTTCSYHHLFWPQKKLPSMQHLVWWANWWKYIMAQAIFGSRSFQQNTVIFRLFDFRCLPSVPC